MTAPKALAFTGDTSGATEGIFAMAFGGGGVGVNLKKESSTSCRQGFTEIPHAYYLTLLVKLFNDFEGFELELGHKLTNKIKTG
jgi:hypothetical protein